MWVLREQIEIN